MSRLTSSWRAALGTIVLLAGAVTAHAQEQGTATPPPAAPAAGTAAPATVPQTPPPAAATTTPSTTTVPAAAGAAGNKGTAAPTPAPAPAAETPPAQGTEPSAATPPPAGQTPAPTAGDAEKLPDVEIIQTQPSPAPEPTLPDAPPSPPKVVKKKPPPVEPEPQPVIVQAKPKPKPVQQAQPAPEPQQVAEPAPQPAELPPPVGGPPAGETLVKISPIAGSEIPLDKVPGAVGIVSAADVARNGTGQVQNVLQQQVPGIILSDTAGSGFRTDVSYRGFDASPIGGRSQALAVYMNGIRINESFGDTVNFDAIPSIAISNMAVVGNNPVFGLNAIGGAISIRHERWFRIPGCDH